MIMSNDVKQDCSDIADVENNQTLSRICEKLASNGIMMEVM